MTPYSKINLRSIQLFLHAYRDYCSVNHRLKNKNYIGQRLYQKIKVNGPITLADYMKEVLTSPTMGYYMHNDMFGASGDFVTSPEITQMFGEMIGVWLVNEWHKMGSPKPLQLVELGPGKGTLASDILKVFNNFKLLNETTLQLVEISPALSELQSKKLCRQTTLNNYNHVVYREGMTHEGIPVNWYKNLPDVPKCFTLLIAHEFFDALPIHKFVRTNKGYREVLIDIDPVSVQDQLSGNKFRYILARHETPMQKKLIGPNEKREHIEVSPDSMIIYRDICERIKLSGGLALICDYGSFESTDTFRAFKKHKQVDPLVEPGSSDLTADVDFSIIKHTADEVKDILTFGPVTQREFLLNIGLEYRFKCLKEKMSDTKDLKNLQECYQMLIDKDKMGDKFKFMALFPETMKDIFKHWPVVGF